MNIYKHEFKMSVRSVITWSVSLALMILLYMTVFTSMANDAELMNQALSKFPPQLLAAFGMTDTDFASVLGFFGFIFLFCQICLAIQASNYGFGLVSVEERDLTADFLLAKPVGRPSIMTSKLLAALTALTITNLVVWASSFGFIALFKGDRTYDAKPLVLLLLSIVIFQLFFLSVGLFISLLVKRVRSVTSFSMALAFGMYVLNAFAGMLGDASLDLISPFKHFDPSYIIKHAAYDTPLVLANVAVIVLAIAGSYLLYSKRNIPSVT